MSTDTLHVAPALAGRTRADDTVRQAGEVRSARLESLRALAALGVLVGHVWAQSRGYDATETMATYGGRVLLGGGFGVWLFFALSGYLLFWPFARAAFRDGGAIDLRRYARNRALRILPLYYVVLVVVLIVQEGGGTFEQWWRFALFAENFSTETIRTVDGPMWSLVIELHFYLLLPLLAWAVVRVAGGSLTRAALAVGALGAASLALWLVQVTFADQASVLWAFNLPATFFFFVAGIELALLRLAWERRPPAALAGPAGSAPAWLAAGAVVWLVVCWDYELQPLAALASFLTVGACVLPLRGQGVLGGLDWRPLVAVGIASYSLYLWQVPVIDGLADLGALPSSFAALLAVLVPACIAIALASYAAVEAPFLRLRRRWSDR
jgi:peptidoglycan/LPS O-acetylase OafA/YrhL